jgi:hypothetical protein
LLLFFSIKINALRETVKNLMDHGNMVKDNLLDAGKKEDDCKVEKAVMQVRVNIKSLLKI